jgi:hypothetical protein
MTTFSTTVRQTSWLWLSTTVSLRRCTPSGMRLVSHWSSSPFTTWLGLTSLTALHCSGA